ncbi:hypothetical protein V3C99_008055, partial [Haemonchus contortus]
HSTKTSTLANFVIYGRIGVRATQQSTRLHGMQWWNDLFDETSQICHRKRQIGFDERVGHPQKTRGRMRITTSWFLVMEKGETCLVRHQIHRSSWSTPAYMKYSSQHFS